MELFWKDHDPYSPPWSTQYKSAIYYHDDEQRRLAERTRDELAQRSGKQVRTALVPVERFYYAEDYHQKYYLRNSESFESLRSGFASEREFIDSTEAARANGR